MSTFKVIHKTTARRFTLAPNSTFSNLGSQLRNLFHIPPSIPITISYTDEDGDAITVSTDLELQEIISQQSTNRPIKLLLNIPTEYTREFEPFTVDKDIEEISKSQQKPESRPSYTYKHVECVDEEAEEPLYESYRNSKESGKQKSSETTESRVNEKEVKEEENNEENNDKPHVIFIKFIRPQRCSNYRNWEFEGHFDYFSRFDKSYCADPANSCGPRVERQGFRSCHQYNQLTFEQLAENIKTLNSMGFVSDNARYEALLKKYSRLERVVEILVREQEESDRATSSKSEKQSNFEREQETSQSFVPVMDADLENHPYSL
ncbi:4633_t:CDS:2 [Acaulospora colombiana]|uniref:4633_t:CDS:1 n=1 Tax=Acaulospora colombiana TaxID=27376 RepID=A0ACA9MCH8_9GLOM|nr:4633_t:CDS:2 [Acaulospora colombiana]